MPNYDLNETDGRIILQEDARLFQIEGVLAILDSPFIDYTNVKLNSRNPVSIKDFTRNKIGYGNLFVKNNKLIVEAAIDYHSPERFDIEIKNKLYFSASGFLTMRPKAPKTIDFYGHQQEATEIVIYSLFLTKDKPLDTRIVPIGTPIL